MATKRHNRQDSPTNPPDLPEPLARAMQRALDGTFPTATEEELKVIPVLYQMLSPRLVSDPNHNGRQEPRKLLREPLLMVSWDRLASAWKVGITDKTLDLTGAEPVRSLLTALADAEELLASGRFRFKTRKVT